MLGYYKKLKCFLIKTENNLAFYKRVCRGNLERITEVHANAENVSLIIAMIDDGVELLPGEAPLTVFNSVETGSQ